MSKTEKSEKEKAKSSKFPSRTTQMVNSIKKSYIPTTYYIYMYECECQKVKPTGCWASHRW